ncbi:MAG TPA: hypothetical protein VFZ65_13240 [Planctomycetota bacterium]|nr:hypothetical protein [Planctomycetota bacterium]
MVLLLGAVVAFVVLQQRGTPAPPPVHEPPAGPAPGDPGASAGGPVRTEPADTSASPGPTAAPGPSASQHALSGVVVDELDAPVRSFRVVQVPAATTQSEAAQRSGMPFADALGRFECRSNGPGPFGLLVSSQGFVAAWQSPVAGDEPVRIRLQRPALIHGRTFGPDGTPIGGINIECLETRSPLDVAYRTASTPEGSYQLLPRAPGGFLVRVHGETNTRFAACQTGSPVRLDIDVPPATTVTVRLASGGRPLADVPLTLHVLTADRVSKTDATGAATWLCVPRGYHELRVSTPGYEAQLHVIDTSNENKTQFERTVELVPQAH